LKNGRFDGIEINENEFEIIDEIEMVNYVGLYPQNI
jgi:hypothetical protein